MVLNSVRQDSGSKGTCGLNPLSALLFPGYVQACRALMIAASVLGLPAILLLLTVLPCIRMGHEPGVATQGASERRGILWRWRGPSGTFKVPQIQTQAMTQQKHTMSPRPRRGGSRALSGSLPARIGPHSVPSFFF